MEAQNNQHETQPAPAAKAPVSTSCRKKKSDDATFLQDVKDHIDEFIHASMDEHKTCFSKTIKKVSREVPKSILILLPELAQVHVRP